MKKLVLMSMGLPVLIRNRHGKLATIELNKGSYVVCRFHPNNPIYLGDANLEGWYPVNFFRRLIYKIKDRLSKYLPD